MPPAVVAAGIGAAASIGGGILAGRSQRRAADRASDEAARTAAANNALQRETRDMAITRLDPYAYRGNEAGNAINALLGISGTMQPGMPGYTPVPGSAGAAGSSPAYSADMWRDGIPGNAAAALPADIQALRRDGIPGNYRAAIARHNTQPVAPPTTTPPARPGGMPGTPGAMPGHAAYENAFANYRNSTGYQFQMDQGTQAINQGYAARGSLQSGAALKALQTYGQNTATGFFKDYLGLLSNQQGVGLSGASAVAGVGQNYANGVSANNNNAGSAAANAALMRGNANANMWGTIAGGIGGIANAFGSSYRPGG